MKKESHVPDLSQIVFPYTMRIDWFAWMFFGGLIGFFLWVFGTDYLRTKRMGDLGFIALTIYSLLCLLRIKIRIAESDIEYWCSFLIFKPIDKVSFEKIRKVETVIRPSGRAWRYWMELYGSNEKLLSMNIKWFSKKDLSVLVQAISKKSSNAELDHATERIKGRIMPSILG